MSLVVISVDFIRFVLLCACCRISENKRFSLLFTVVCRGLALKIWPRGESLQSLGAVPSMGVQREDPWTKFWSVGQGRTHMKSNGGESNIRVGGKPRGLGDGSPPEDESFSKNMYKIWSNLTKNFNSFALL